MLEIMMLILIIPYYSYFQYLPMRSQTTYTGSQISNYLNNKAGSTSKLYNTGDIFIKYQNKYGVNALMAASFAALESGWGKSNIALNKNNLFGLNATDNNPGGNADTFSTVDDCIMNFTSSWMSKRYLNPTYTSLFRGGYFGDKGSGIFGKYSSDPYEGEKCASIAKNMDASISSKDNDYYTLGIKDIYLTTHTALNVRSSSNTSSSVLYTTIKNPAYSFIIKDAYTTNGFYKIQSEVASSDGTYSFNNTGYVSNRYVTLLNNISHTQGWKKENNYWYYYFSNGSKATGLQTIENNLYYFNTSGQMQTGWQEVNNKWYYFDELGYGQKNWKLIGNNWFYFNSSYQMQTGWQEINGKWYYLSTGVMKIYGKTYYEGYMITGWLPLGNDWYYLNSDGSMVTGLQTVGNNFYYFNASGKMQTGWQGINNKWYYFDNGGYGQKGWQMIAGNTYYFLDSYQMATGFQEISGNTYFFSTGVMKIYGKTYYEGCMVTSWLTLGSDWYYFDNTGKRLTGLQKVGNNLFYFNDSGKMQTGWQKVSNKWYYFDDSGYGQSGWKKLGNTWFYFNSQYQMLTGWQRINGKWYYLSTGVMEIYGKTYYEGYMVTGWLQLENKWYYLKSDGSMVTGYYKVGNKTYYFNSSGVMQ